MSHQMIWTPVLVHLGQVLGLYLVLVGLIGVKKEYLEITPFPRRLIPLVGLNEDPLPLVGLTWTPPPLEYKQSVDKIVMIIIDALRVDFITEDLPFTLSLLNSSHGCFFKTKVKSPTVTLPRIKAIVSGDISTYWDIIQNVNSKQITQDNIVWHATRELNKKVVFYGDDTWLALFPKEFTRSEGTSSFFVTDFTEVDFNVTRHLQKELSPDNDWDMLILHYLGLDHIGHVHGPKSTLIPGKLREMDSIIQTVYQHLLSTGQNSILIVCGDHGMANIGGHGGDSYHETTTAFLAFSTKKLPNCFEKKDESISVAVDINQIDIAPTISAVWGMTFPAASAGKLIWPLFAHLSLLEQLSLAYYNAIQLRKFAPHDELASGLVEITQRHVAFITNNTNPNSLEGEAILKSYQEIITKMSSAANDQLGQQNIIQMTSGVMLCLHSALLLYYRKSSQISAAGLCFSAICSILQDSATYPGFLVLLQLVLLLFATCRFAFEKLSLPDVKLAHNFHLVHWFNFILQFFYFSSSFIEEEQYLWYYLWPTGVVIVFLNVPHCQLDSVGYKYRRKNAKPDSDLSQAQSTKSSKYTFGFSIVLLLVTHRLALAWNRTGQKWSHLEDLSDFVQESQCIPPVVLLSFLLLWVLRVARRRQRQKGIFTILLVSVLLLKIEPSLLPTIVSTALPSPVLVQLILVVTLVYFVSNVNGGKPYNALTTWTNIFLLLTLVVQKYENVSLVTMIFLQVEALHRIFKKTRIDDHSVRDILVLWLSYAAFFYKGNSNSITTIDVNSGYLGLTSYNEVVVGLLIFCNTFSLSALVILVNVELVKLEETSCHEHIPSLFKTLSKSQSLTIVIYSIVISLLRHHLFIWSVFAPKLLYLIGFTMYYAVLATIYALIHEIKKAL